MAKNLKLTVKNAQLAEALKKLKKPEELKKQPEAPVLKEKKAPEPAPVEKPAPVEIPEPVLETPQQPPVSPPEPPPEIEAEEEEEEKPLHRASEPKSAEKPPVQRVFAPGYKPSSYTGGRPSSRPPYQQGQQGGAPRPQHPPRPPSGNVYIPRKGPLPPGVTRPAFQPRRPYGPPSGPGSSTFRPPSRPGMPPLRPMAPRPEDLKRVRPSREGDEAKKATPAKDFREVKPQKKQEEFRAFDSRDRQGLRGDEEEQLWRRKRRASTKMKPLAPEEIIRPKALKVRIPITIKDLASEMKLKASQLIAKLFMKGIILTLNDFLDDETTIQLLGHDFDCEITIDTSEEKRLQITDKTIKEEIQETDPSLLILRPPVVTFMGHVDHGKTSLIDAIRKSNVAAGEAGAITQHIGAFRCHTAVGDIAILDTPGHEAFSAMRSRGADVTDIVVLVIAGDEGMRAQTVEALEQAQEAHVPIMVAINKSDKPNFNAETVYRQLSEKGLLPEVWGGQTITVNCSAVTGEGIAQLLEMLALQAEILELKANPQARARGTVIESEMHKGMGAVATMLVQNGTLRLGDAIVFGQCWGRVKTMQDEHGKDLSLAGPSTPAKITGLSDLPEAGSEFIVVRNDKEARAVAEDRALKQKSVSLQAKKAGLENLLQQQAQKQERKVLNLILRADVQGSLEALKHSLEKITSTKITLNIISSEVGEISESDVELASASKATIVGFHTQVESRADALINELKVSVRLHDIIYHAADDVKGLMVALLDKIAQENDIGVVAVKAVFKSSQLGNIAGCQVTEGIIRRNSHVRLVRNKEVIWKGALASLKRVKEDVREASKGQECGVLLQGFSDVKEGDILQVYDISYLTQEL